MSRPTAAKRVAGIATRVAIVAGALGLATTVGRSLPEDSTPLHSDTFVMATSFSDYGLGAYLISVGAAAVAFVARRGPLPLVVGALSLGIGALHASWIVPRYLGDDRPVNSTVGSTVGFTLLSQNLKLGEADPDSAMRAAENADVVVLVEATGPILEALRARGWNERFPYATPNTLPSDGADGSAVFSRFPLRGGHPLSGLLHQTWSVTVAVPHLGDVELLAVHPVRPFRGGTDWRTEQDLLRRLIPTTPRTIVSGDFNAVDSHRPLRLLRADGYRSSTDLAGAGHRPTYPSNEPVPPLIEIDHVLLGPGLTATASTTVNVAGSDHLGVLAEITGAA